MAEKTNKRKYLNRRLGCLLAVGLVLFACMTAAALQQGRGTAGFTAALVIAAAAVLLCLTGYFVFYVPYRETTLDLGSFSTGNLAQDVDQIQYPYNREMDRAMEQMRRYMEQASALETSKRQAQYQALQNQINPHFLYNTLESIRSEAVLSGLDSVDAMCEALANYFRYTISNMENVVSVRDELANIRNYFTIQQYRFEDRLTLGIEGDDSPEALECLLPKLTLQPIVENAIIHGLERMVGPGRVIVRLTLTQKRLLILVSDNGLGMKEETLRQINREIAANVSHSGSRGGIAIGNVNNRIQLVFGEEYGVTVYSTEGAGTDVEIALPRTTRLDMERYRQREYE